MQQEDRYLDELITRICDRSDFTFAPGFDSTKTISWKAMREAEKLDNPKYIPALEKIIDKEEDQRRRGRAYFILGQLALNTADPSVASYFIQRIQQESDVDLLSSMLLNLKPLYKPKGTNIQPLLQLLLSSEEEVRHAAIQALNHCEDAEAENALIGILTQPVSNIDLILALETLGDTGSSRSMSTIQRYVNSKDKDVRSAAAAAIAAIKGRRK